MFTLSLSSARFLALGISFSLLVVTACTTHDVQENANDGAPAPPADVAQADDAGADASPAPTADASPLLAYPAPHPALPMAVKGNGGVLASPKIVPITFTGDPSLSMITDFTAAIGASNYWKSVVSEYGVGPATSVSPLVVLPTELVSGAATITATDITTFLAEHLDGFHADWGSPDPNAIYTMFLPASVTLERGGTKSCVGFDGYHGATSVNGIGIAYAVIARCNNDNVITVPASHELIEASTDPFADLKAFGYAAVNRERTVANLLPGGELSDLCGTDSDRFYTPIDLNFVVARSWSNVAVTAGKPPCGELAPGSVYFAGAPVLNDDVTIKAYYFAGNLDGTTKGIKVPLGQSRTMDIALFSTAPMDAPFNITLIDAPTLNGDEPELTFALDRDNGVNGDTLHATVTRVKEGPYDGTEIVVEAKSVPVSPKNGAKSEFHLLFGFASND